MDISPLAAAKAQAHSGRAVVIGNAERLPFASGAFDCVTCLGSVENFERPLEAIQEARRVLKPDGLLAVMMPNKFWLGDILQVARGRDEQVPFQRVERMATLPQWRRLMESQGFVVAQIRGYVKRTPLFREGKLRSLKKFLVSCFLSAICPASLAWSVLLICRKAPHRGVSAGPFAWLWRAEWISNGEPSPF
jgi:SAM-dependent methyltransferase